METNKAIVSTTTTTSKGKKKPTTAGLGTQYKVSSNKPASPSRKSHQTSMKNFITPPTSHKAANNKEEDDVTKPQDNKETETTKNNKETQKNDTTYESDEEKTSNNTPTPEENRVLFRNTTDTPADQEGAGNSDIDEEEDLEEPNAETDDGPNYDPSETYSAYIETAPKTLFFDTYNKRKNPRREGFNITDLENDSTVTGTYKWYMKTATKAFDRIHPDKKNLIPNRYSIIPKWSNTFGDVLKGDSSKVKDKAIRRDTAEFFLLLSRTPPEFYNGLAKLSDIDEKHNSAKMTITMNKDTSAWAAAVMLAGLTAYSDYLEFCREDAPKKRTKQPRRKGPKPKPFVHQLEGDAEKDRLAARKSNKPPNLINTPKTQGPPTKYLTYFDLASPFGTPTEEQLDRSSRNALLGKSLFTVMKALPKADPNAYIKAFPRHNSNPDIGDMIPKNYTSKGEMPTTWWTIRNHFDKLLPPNAGKRSIGLMYIAHDVELQEFTEKLQNALLEGDGKTDHPVFTAYISDLQRGERVDIAWRLYSHREEDTEETMEALDGFWRQAGIDPSTIPPYLMKVKPIRAHGKDKIYDPAKGIYPVSAIHYICAREEALRLKELLKMAYPDKLKTQNYPLGIKGVLIPTNVCDLNDFGEKGIQIQEHYRKMQKEYLAKTHSTIFENIDRVDTVLYSGGPTLRNLMLQMKHPKEHRSIVQAFIRDSTSPHKFHAFHSEEDSTLVLDLKAKLPLLLLRELRLVTDKLKTWLSPQYFSIAEHKFPQDPLSGERWISQDVLDYTTREIREALAGDPNHFSAQDIRIEFDPRRLAANAYRDTDEQSTTSGGSLKSQNYSVHSDHHTQDSLPSQADSVNTAISMGACTVGTDKSDQSQTCMDDSTETSDSSTNSHKQSHDSPPATQSNSVEDQVDMDSLSDSSSTISATQSPPTKKQVTNKAEVPGDDPNSPGDMETDPRDLSHLPDTKSGHGIISQIPPHLLEQANTKDLFFPCNIEPKTEVQLEQTETEATGTLLLFKEQDGQDKGFFSIWDNWYRSCVHEEYATVAEDDHFKTLTYDLLLRKFVGEYVANEGDYNLGTFARQIQSPDNQSEIDLRTISQRVRYCEAFFRLHQYVHISLIHKALPLPVNTEIPSLNASTTDVDELRTHFSWAKEWDRQEVSRFIEEFVKWYRVPAKSDHPRPMYGTSLIQDKRFLLNLWGAYYDQLLTTADSSLTPQEFSVVVRTAFNPAEIWFRVQDYHQALLASTNLTFRVPPAQAGGEE
jgi:hypothetical protein